LVNSAESTEEVELSEPPDDDAILAFLAADFLITDEDGCDDSFTVPAIDPGDDEGVFSFIDDGDHEFDSGSVFIGIDEGEEEEETESMKSTHPD
jgi:hypothetical protein